MEWIFIRESYGPTLDRYAVAARTPTATKTSQISEIIGAPERIRTPNLLIRSQVLYPVELRARRNGR
jgi:hypothetical protein